MPEAGSITIISNRKKLVLGVSTVLYVLMTGKNAELHAAGGKVYRTKMSLSELESQLGDGFIKVHRGCLVSAMAIHDVTDEINLSNGETLAYTLRKKKEIIARLYEKRRRIVRGFSTEGLPVSPEEYSRHYSSFECLPFAFADIEMVFDEEKHAVDWIFRYGNPALARLEKLPLERLIGSSFGSLFSNMDAKWLRCYERAALYGEALEIVDYSPEIGTWLKITCFPTFRGHCGCILFDLSRIKYIRSSAAPDQAPALFLGENPQP